MTTTQKQAAAMLRRMAAYLHGESTEATAIINDGRELIDVMAAIIGNRDHELQGLQDQIKKLTDAANVATLVAAHHAIEACKSATGQHRVIDHFVNKTSIAQEAQAAIVAAAQEA